MPFYRKIGDITKVKGGAIVNSLGTNVMSFGKICSTIIRAAYDESIVDAIKNIKKKEPLEYVVTKAGKLSCDYIIHIIVPYKKDDPNNVQLYKCYEKVLNIAIKNGIDSIAIPLIGTGRNGYSKDESSKAMAAACKKIDIQEGIENRPILKMCEYVYLSKRGSYRPIRRDYNDLDLNMNGSSFASIVENRFSLFSCCRFFASADPDQSVGTNFNEFRKLPDHDPKYPYYFLSFIMQQKGINIDDMLSPECNSDARKKFKRVEQLKNKDLIQLAFLCKLTRTETLELMAYNGTCFSPKSRIDMALMDCLANWRDVQQGTLEDLRIRVEELSDCEIKFTKLEDYDEEMDQGWLSAEERKEIKEKYKKKLIVQK